ncbi:hypothetical protein Tco_0167887 [Tanacetum coccineum]
MQTQKSKVDMGKAVDAGLVVTESSGTESQVQDDSSRSGNYTDSDDANIRPIYDEEPMAEVQLTVKYNIFDIGQQHTEQPEIINEEEARKKIQEKDRNSKSSVMPSTSLQNTTNGSKSKPRSNNQTTEWCCI